jgi:hypothetical protein
MLELIICSMLTILPDYLYRRHVQGKRIGKEITLFSVWFELRYGIVACLMVVTGVQDYIAAGQFRGGEQLIEAQNIARPGTILVFLEPLYKGGLEGVTAGSSCIVNAYTSNHELISSGKLSTAKSFGLHAVDAVGLVHALLLRIQALLLPIKTLVLSGH